VPRTDPGDRIYAIGDVHGCYQVMRRLLDRIGEHNDALPPAKSLHIIFLGDLIDRGPESAAVLEFLHDLQKRSNRVIILLGNHEEAMLRVLGGETALIRPWLGFGGRETLLSLGIALPEADEPPREFLRRLQNTVPRKWVRWLSGLPLTAESGEYFFCHAGVRPGIHLARQSRQDLLWIREGFLEATTNFGAVVVHGHSIESQIEVRENRIGVDSGAYRNGTLTAIYLEDDRQELISVD
jgi:serine/threonine protein phosphatase 1